MDGKFAVIAEIDTVTHGRAALHRKISWRLTRPPQADHLGPDSHDAVFAYGKWTSTLAQLRCELESAGNFDRRHIVIGLCHAAGKEVGFAHEIGDIATCRRIIKLLGRAELYDLAILHDCDAVRH